MNKYNPIPIPTRRCDQKPAPTDTTLIELNLDATDYATLMSARYFFASFANPEGAAWLSVILCSQDFYPNHFDSPAIVQAVLEVVHKIRTSRTSMLRFSNPHCLDCANIVTAAERHLMAILRDVRSSNLSGATTHAMLLCEGHETAGVLSAAGRLTDILENKQTC
jgi:hypothetical protein